MTQQSTQTSILGKNGTIAFETRVSPNLGKSNTCGEENTAEPDVFSS